MKPPGEDKELRNVAFIEAPRFCVRDVGEPFDFGRYVGEVAILRGVKVCLAMETRSDIPLLRAV